jgi:hypothetical protein
MSIPHVYFVDSRPRMTVMGFFCRSRAKGCESSDYYERLVNALHIEQSLAYLERLYLLSPHSRIPVEKLMAVLHIVGTE